MEHSNRVESPFEIAPFGTLLLPLTLLSQVIGAILLEGSPCSILITYPCACVSPSSRTRSGRGSAAPSPGAAICGESCCHLADAPSPALLKHLLKGEGGCSGMTEASPTAQAAALGRPQPREGHGELPVLCSCGTHGLSSNMMARITSNGVVKSGRCLVVCRYMETRRSIYIEDAITLKKEITTSIKAKVEATGQKWGGEPPEGEPPVRSSHPAAVRRSLRAVCTPVCCVYAARVLRVLVCCVSCPCVAVCAAARRPLSHTCSQFFSRPHIHGVRNLRWQTQRPRAWRSCSAAMSAGRESSSRPGPTSRSTSPHSMDCHPTRWPESPRVVVQCAP